MPIAPFSLNLPPMSPESGLPADAMLSPQAVLSYLVPVYTNAATGQLEAPVFVPPMPPPEPSSTATYESH